MTCFIFLLSGCGQSYNPKLDKDCRGCDLSGTSLTGVDLSEANLRGAILFNANLKWANLDGVFGADYSRAKNVPAKYLKD